jgi:hypothetical protein
MSDVSDVPRERVQEIAAYIRDMAIELAAMAKSAQCDTLHSVLEMAEMEASRLIDGRPPQFCLARPGPEPRSEDAA